MKFLFSIIVLVNTSFANDQLRKFCKSTVEKAESVRAVEGKDQWLFPFVEIKHLAKESQYLEKALLAIIDYKKALEKESIELLVVPVPPKGLIYKEHLVDVHDQWNPYLKFHEALKKQNVKSLDLVPVFYDLKKEKQVFCKRDSHFSPAMAKVIADSIFSKSGFKNEDWELKLEKLKVDFEGDLVRQSEKKFGNESFEIEYLTMDKKFINPNAGSPVILVGDSNSLIFSSGGDMHTRGAGVFDFLNLSFGQPVDLIGVKGSGIDQARVDFFRRSMDLNYLKKKKLVIWLFAAYELTESRGWKNIPVRR